MYMIPYKWLWNDVTVRFTDLGSDQGHGDGIFISKFLLLTVSFRGLTYCIYIFKSLFAKGSVKLWTSFHANGNHLHNSIKQ